MTIVNELVDVGTFLRMHLMPELSHPNINERPIVKVHGLRGEANCEGTSLPSSSRRCSLLVSSL